MTILLTGGAGFIGSHIVDRLVELGHKTIIIDNLSSGKRKNINKEACTYFQDINDGLMEIFKEQEIDYVIHLAAQTSVINSVKNPYNDAKANVLGTINLLECCRKHGVKKIVFASTGGAIYGNPQYLPMDENHPINPLSPYGLNKYVAERYLELYKEFYGIDYVALRYSNVYGPRQDPYGEAGVVAIFIDKLMNNEKPSIFGTGGQTRDFIYVSDVVDANIIALEKGSGAYNIGTGIPTSVNEIFKLLQKVTKNHNIKPIYAEERTGEVKHCYLNCKKAEKELDWEPKVSLEEGLKIMVEDLKND